MVKKNKLKEIMQRKGMRLKDLSSASGLRPDILHYYVEDKKVPNVYSAILIAKALHLDVNEIFIVE